MKIDALKDSNFRVDKNKKFTYLENTISILEQRMVVSFLGDSPIIAGCRSVAYGYSS
ncbi:MAG: hypothetical protein K0S24_2552 [Sphingobacterium sp.]|jgi:hypothetical protein|nr:hypothetical protein [Sphingobacterium sp.]